MARTQRRVLVDIARLGVRLRDLRGRAGLSQMQLARAIGFNPTHGYKYVLRLEKGLVPNPTLRTIASVLDACHADWSDVADVLPLLSGAVRPRPATEPVAVVIAPGNRDEPPPIPTQRGGKPLREWLRQRRREDQRTRQRRHWEHIGRAEEQVEELVNRIPQARTLRRQYVALVKRLCTALDGLSEARPGLLESELGKIVEAGALQGLDRELILRIRDICVGLGRA